MTKLSKLVAAAVVGGTLILSGLHAGSARFDFDQRVDGPSKSGVLTAPAACSVSVQTWALGYNDAGQWYDSRIEIAVCRTAGGYYRSVMNFADKREFYDEAGGGQAEAGTYQVEAFAWETHPYAMAGATVELFW